MKILISTHRVEINQCVGCTLSSRRRIDGVEVKRENFDFHTGMHQYYVKVVPTVYSYLDGSTREVWQYSVTEHVRHVTPGSGRGLPGVFFFYEVSPLVAEFEERRQGWRALLTGLAAIVGGVHATAALVDRTLAALLAKHSSRGLTH